MRLLYFVYCDQVFLVSAEVIQSAALNPHLGECWYSLGMADPCMDSTADLISAD